MGLSFAPSTHSRHSSHTLSTAHASRTHVKAPQTDFHIKPDNSSGLTHDSPSERPLRTKVTFQPRQAPKSSEESHASPNRERTDQAKHGPTPLHALTSREPGPRPEGQHRTQDRILLLAQSHGRSIESIRSDSMARHCRHRRLRSLVYRDRFPSLSLERKILSFFLSLCISSILSTSIPISIYIELQFLQ